MKGILQWVIIIAIVVFVFKSCSSDSKDDVYKGYYYPDIQNMDIKKEFGPFSELQECKDVIDDWRVTGGRSDTSSDGECALNCTYRQQYGLEVCEETFDA